MQGKIPSNPALSLFQTPLVNFIDESHSICQLAQQIEWDAMSSELAEYYSDKGRPSVPIRKIVGLLILKRMFNESDESVMDRWIENPYWQYFTGEVYFQTQGPFDPSDFVHFRKRVGKDGLEKILKYSIPVDEREKEIKRVAIDPTVQPKNITYPTDTKLHVKIIKRCWKIAKQNGIRFRQSFKRKIKEWLLELRFKNHPKKQKRARRAARLIKNKSKVLLRDLERKLLGDQLSAYEELFTLFKKVINQKRTDINKIYSLHEVDVHCINKGKVFPKYEFGTKASIGWDMISGYILGAVDGRNKYDGKLLEPTLDQIKRITGQEPLEAVVDRGCRGKKQIGNTKIIRPSRSQTTKSRYEKEKERKKMRKRAGIEPIISHLKYDHRMIRCFLSGKIGDQNNMLLAAIGFNMRRRLKWLKSILLALLPRLLWKAAHPWVSRSGDYSVSNFA